MYSPFNGRKSLVARLRRILTSSHKPQSQRARRPCLGLECLETRELLSASFAGDALSSGALSPTHDIVGSAANLHQAAMVGQSATLTGGSPTAPTFTATAASGTQINLSWNAVSGASGYLVDEWINGAWSQIGTFGSGVSSDTVTGLSPGATYYFDVASYNSSGTTWANYQSVATINSGPPAAPTFTATATSGTQINLSWNAVSGASGYLVDEWINGAWSQIGTFGSGVSSDTVTGLSPGVTYYFDVASYNSSGTTWANYQSVATINSSPPAAPTFTATAASGTQINLSWNAVSGASGYLVDEWINGAWSQIGNFGSGVSSDAVTGLSPGVTYYFDVASYNSSGTTWANYQSVATIKSGPPAAPTFTSAAASGTQINLSWNAVSGASGYLVDEWINGAWSQIGTFGSGVSSDTVTGLTPGVTYYFDVAAYNSSGTTWANYQSVATINSGPPAAPTFTATAASGTQINLSWNAVSGASGYMVDEWINGAWSQIGSFGSGVSSDTVTGLTPGTTYYFDVAAYNSSGTTWASYQSVATSQNQQTVNNPTAATAYSPVSGTLFGANGPSYLDVQQGQVGDCWLMSSLAEVAARDPADIQSMFTYQGTTTDNGSVVGVYTVRFFNSAGTAEYVTVDTELPSGGGYYDQPINGVLWPALAEKAYAEANGAGYVTTGSLGSDSYAALNDGDPVWALQAITGKSASDFSINPTNIASAWNAGELIVLTTTTPASTLIVGSHAYAVVGYNATSSQPFEVFNPWGTNSAGWAPSTYNGNQVYGLFNATATFLSQNFNGQSIGNGAEAGGTAALTGPADRAPAAEAGTLAGVGVADASAAAGLAVGRVGAEVSMVQSLDAAPAAVAAATGSVDRGFGSLTEGVNDLTDRVLADARLGPTEGAAWETQLWEGVSAKPDWLIGATALDSNADGVLAEQLARDWTDSSAGPDLAALDEVFAQAMNGA